MRPIHCLVSWNKTTNLIFGHDSHGHFCCGDDHNCAKVSMVCPSDQTNQPAAAAAGTALEKPVSNTEEQHPPVGGVTRLAEMMTIYFDFDKSDLRPDQLDRIEKNLKYLKEHPELKIMIEGHCDERGTTEYNLALGERRAKSVMNYYVKNGIAADRIMMVSKGEEQPADPGHTEEAWSKNRRAEFDKVN
ncbi:peptidoglycan-associated lipoprotein Pal [Candidatus Sumerlaeota bacterium]|nr:peptidoglycan-associated lipoprotein Pal [Candidatus Sumerlaeota bacterium]MBI3735213.1 peptidoglycan-associated lipoprotein Pal [Candidatus Sumerlaeota bacterium]